MVVVLALAIVLNIHPVKFWKKSCAILLVVWGETENKTENIISSFRLLVILCNRSHPRIRLPHPSAQNQNAKIFKKSQILQKKNPQLSSPFISASSAIMRTITMIFQSRKVETHPCPEAAKRSVSSYPCYLPLSPTEAPTWCGISRRYCIRFFGRCAG
jgi:hypothetical protein